MPNFNVSIVFWPSFMTLDALPQSVIDQVAQQYENDSNERVKNMTKNLKHDPQKLKELKDVRAKFAKEAEEKRKEQAEKLKEAGGSLNISNLKPAVKRIFDVIELTTLFEIFETENEALKGFEQA